MYIKVIVKKGGVHINSYYDGHEQLLKQLNIEDTIENRGVKFVKVRVECANWDVFNSINQISETTIEDKAKQEQKKAKRRLRSTFLTPRGRF